MFRRAAKGIIPNADDVAATAVTVAATATTTAAVVAATASSVAAALHTEISGQFETLRTQLTANTKEISELRIFITGFMSACPERHKAIDQRLTVLDRAMK